MILTENNEKSDNYLFIVHLMTATNSEYRKMERLMKNNLERKWKEEIVAHFKVLSRYCLGGTE